MSDINNPVLSANRDVKNSVAFGKSLINKKKQKQTLEVTLIHFCVRFCFLNTDAHCFLLVR